MCSTLTPLSKISKGFVTLSLSNLTQDIEANISLNINMTEYEVRMEILSGDTSC